MVWEYSLGAYELGSMDASRVAGGASVAGIGTEASRSEQTEVLRKAGKIADCSKVDNFACRVPIRVTLRAIRADDGAAPASRRAWTLSQRVEPSAHMSRTSVRGTCLL